jgi:pentose-5-phosphate-3-epimerase
MRKIFVPSAPFKNYEEIESLAQKGSGEVKRIQIDVCDGKYVPSVSWPFTEYPKGDFEKLGEKPDFDVYLPLWESINYSVDLMVENPDKYLQTFIAYGVDEVVMHFRSLFFGTGDNKGAAESKDISVPLGRPANEIWEKILEKCKYYEISLVLAVDVQTDLNEFIKFAKENLENISAFQVMGIEKIGFQGQDFDERSLAIVKKLKKEFPDMLVALDGGITDETVKEIGESGVDVFCVGHFLTDTADFEGNLHTLKQML